MKKDCYISSINLMDNISAYAYLLISSKEQKIEEVKTGEFHVQDSSKASMYVTDLVSQHNRGNTITFHFDSLEDYNYVTEKRKIRASYHSFAIKNEYTELTKKTLEEYVKLNYNRLYPIFELQKKER